MKGAIVFVCLALGTLTFAEDAKEFSNPPSNLPVKKIYVHGAATSDFSGGYANNPSPPVAPQGYESNVPAYSQQQPAPTPPQQPSFQNLPVQEQGQQGNLGEGFQTGNLGEAPAAPAPAPVAPEPIATPAPAPEPAGPKYPLPECYTNKNGFMCCNHDLEDVVNQAYDELKASRNGQFPACNIQIIANKVQLLAEKRFNTTFETVAGVGDYASKSRFYHNYICKVERDGRIILAYATPRKDRLPQDEPVIGGGQEGANGPPPYKAHHHTFVWRK